MVDSIVNLGFFILLLSIAIILLLLKNKGRYLIVLSIIFLLMSLIFDILTLIEYNPDIFLSGIPIPFLSVWILTTLSFLIPSIIGLLYFEDANLRQSFQKRVGRRFPKLLSDILSIGIAFIIIGIPLSAFNLANFEPLSLATSFIPLSLLFSYPLFRFSFFVILSGGFISGQTLADADIKRNKGVIESILIIASLVLVILSAIGIDFYLSFLYFDLPVFGVVYLGLFFIFQIIIYTLTAMNTETKLIPITLLANLGLMLLLVENLDTVAEFPVELPIYLGILFPLGLLIGFYFARKDSVSFTSKTLRHKPYSGYSVKE